MLSSMGSSSRIVGKGNPPHLIIDWLECVHLSRSDRAGSYQTEDPATYVVVLFFINQIFPNSTVILLF